MKTLMILLSLFITNPPESIYQFKMESIDGQTIDLSQFKGKKILVVNTASKCGYTPQYKGLEELSQKYKDDLVVIGVPANNFGGQEPGANDEIQTFCEENYGVTFLLTEKTSVKGDDINALFDYLTSAQNPDFTGEIKWNFEKFLIDENGKLIHRFRSDVEPMSAAILANL
ncbi:glutathione peroxidase [Albibacterium bauzanense]|nr:glutathione peroxidase [Albibacterium bauzanense]